MMRDVDSPWTHEIGNIWKWGPKQWVSAPLLMQLRIWGAKGRMLLLSLLLYKLKMMMRLLTEFFPRVRSPFSRQYFSGRGWPLRWTFVNPSLTSLLGHFTNSFTVSTSSFLYEQSSIVLSTSELRVYNSVLPTKLLSCWGNETIPISTSHPFCHFTILIQRLSWALKNVAKRIPQCPSDATILVVKRRRKPQCSAVQC